jgi:hypothetical protein
MSFCKKKLRFGKWFSSLSSEVTLLFFVFRKLSQTVTPVGSSALEILHIYDSQRGRVPQSSTERNVVG